MSDIQYLEFLKQVLPFAPDVPDAVAIHATRNAIIELCEKSHIYVYECDPLDLIAGENSYELDIPQDTAIVAIREFYVNDRLLTPFAPDQLKNNPGGIDWRTLEGTPTAYSHMEPASVVVCPRPAEDVADAGKAIVALKPTRNSSRVTDVLLERWGEGIGIGARARLLEYPGVWQNLTEASRLHLRFSEVCSEAKRVAYKGHTRAALSVAMPRIV